MSVIHIATPADLQNMAADLSANYVLDNDLDMTGFPWVPVGDISTPFLGTFDGGGNTISNLVYDDTLPGLGYGGLFGSIGDGDWSTDIGVARAIIHDITLTNFVLTGNYQLGALAGASDGCIINNVHVINVTLNPVGVSASSYGALIGFVTTFQNLPSSITDCDADDVTVVGGDDDSVGGLIGFIEGGRYNINISGTITNCFVVDVYIENNNPVTEDFWIGGFVGFSRNVQYINCYATGEIHHCYGGTGGFAGISEYDIFDTCYADVDITATAVSDGDDYDVGGFAGGAFDSGFVNCYALGDIAMNSASFGDIAGFIGYFDSSSTGRTISKCFSTGSVSVVVLSGLTSEIAGFVGGSYGGAIHDCYHLGSINVDYGIYAPFYIGGFIGYNQINIKDCYHFGQVNGHTTTGGFIGDTDSSPDIINCYAVGGVDGVSDVGGFIGRISTLA